MEYKGFIIKKDGFNYRVKTKSGANLFGEPAASVKTAKKWIDAFCADKLARVK